MSEPIIPFGIGFLFAVLIALGAFFLMRLRGRRAVLQLPAPSSIMTVIEEDMDQLHSQIAVATRRLEICVEQMKAKTTSQLAEIGKTGETVGRLKAEITERNSTLSVLQDKEKAVGAQLRATQAELAERCRSLEETERQLTDRRAELAKLLAESDIHPELAQAQARHAAEMDALKAEKAATESELANAREESGKLQAHIDELRKQVETTWASERMANAVLRERINDVASEVVRVAVALEGLNSPIDSLVASKGAGIEAAIDDSALAPSSSGNGSGPPAAMLDGGSNELIHRIRALRQRSARLSTPPDGH
jgi:chromosome segregation ATPase